MKLISFSSKRAVLLLAVASLWVLVGASCSTDEASAMRSADTYFAAGEYEKAEIEYKNFLQANGQNGHAIGRLGVIYLEQGRIRQSVPFLLKARQLQPENLEVRDKLAMLYLSSGKFAEVREEAAYILAREPTHYNAPVLLVESSLATPEDVAAARDQFAQLPAEAQAGAPVITALGLIELRQKNIAGAEAAFKRAIEANPKLAAAHSALGALYWSQGDRENAGNALKAAADVAPPRSGKTLQYAQFKIRSGDQKAGKEILEELNKKVPDYLPALSVLAEMAVGEKRYDEGDALAAKILARDPNHIEARLLVGRLHLVRGDPRKAAEEIEKLLQVFPNHPQGLYFLGVAYAAAGERLSAIDRLGQAIKVSPMPEAILALAGINLKTGDYNAVIVSLVPFVKQHPNNLQARLMLAEAYRAQGNSDDALATYRLVEKEFPNIPQASFQAGLTLLQQRNRSEAKKAFAESLRRAPDYLPGLEQLINMDLAEKQFDVALDRLTPELTRNPKSAGLHLLRGRILGVQGKTEEAEIALKQSIEIAPSSPTAYFELAQFYAKNQQQTKALASLDAVIRQNPNDLKALLMFGLINDQQKNHEAARDAYEKIIAIDPKSTLALNNLSYLYSERFNDLDKAYETALKARESSSEEPHTADTFGWILYKKGQYDRALSMLEESAAALPNLAEVQYHLGMARYMTGLEESARQALQRALELNNDLPGAADIRRRLSILAIDPSAPSAEAITTLEKVLVEDAGDPIALSRLALAYERAGEATKAVASYQAAVQANPASPAPLLGLARLYTSTKETQKALEAAKAARKLAPDDPAVARALGSIAHQTGDSVWAASLLQEAVRRQPDDAELLFEAAQVVYTVGKVSEAREMTTQALAPQATTNSTLFQSGLNPKFSKTEQAREFLEMTALASEPDPKAEPRIQQILKTDPVNVPALMAAGAIKEQKSDQQGASETYKKVLATAPDFVPAKLRLALLSAEAAELDPKAVDWARQARTAYPRDPSAAKALGILTYRSAGDAPRAISLLREALTAVPADAVSLYYLGQAQIQNKETANGRQSLQKAIELGLPPEFRTEAQNKIDAAK